MHGRLAAGVSRRPGTVLLAGLVLVAIAGVLATRAPERVAVVGGAGPGGDAAIVVVARAKPAVGASVLRQTLGVIRSGIAADPAVRRVEPLRTRSGADVAALAVRLDDLSALERQEAAARIAERIDPGPLEVAVGGEAALQAEARSELEADLGRLALLAAPLILAVLLVSFGWRHAIAPILAGAAGALGGIAFLGVLASAIDLGAVGLAVAGAVGLAVGVEACFVVRRSFGEVPAAAPEEMLAEALDRAWPRIAIGVAACSAACLASLAIGLPAARSAALGGAAAALLAGASALVVMPAALVRWPRPARPEPAGVRGGRLRDAVAVRPWLGWIPAIAVLATLVVAGAHAFDPDVSVQGAGDLAGTEPARAAELLRSAGRDVGQAKGGGRDGGIGVAGAETDGATAEQELDGGVLIVAGLLTAIGLLAGFASSGSWRGAIANGVAAALPALAVCGLLWLAGKGSLPLGIDLDGQPHLSAFLAALATAGGISAARAALRDPRSAVAGSLVAGTAAAALLASQLDGVAQTGAAIAAGLAIDLLLVRLALAPALAHALPHEAGFSRRSGW